MVRPPIFADKYGTLEDTVKAPEAYAFSGTDWCPNNSACPLLVYRACFAGAREHLAECFERTFRMNAWPPAWRYTIYDYPHYHSTSHEVIGVFRGEAQVRFGDSAGVTLHLVAGDAVVIPAGVSHERRRQAEDFTAVGAYPEDFFVDELRRSDAARRDEAARRIAGLPIPPDPLDGDGGFLPKLWNADR